MEIFFSRIPKSQNHFRAKVKEEVHPLSSSHSLGRAVSPDMAKGSLDVEIDGKRQTVTEEEFDDIQSQIESVGVRTQWHLSTRLKLGQSQGKLGNNS